MTQKVTKSLRLSFLMTRIYLKRNWQTFLIIFSLLFVALFLQFRFNLVRFDSNSLSEGFVGTYQLHDLPLEVTRLLSEGLVEPDQSGRMKPKLASWTVNKDATVYRFKLEKNLMWVDGTPVKSSDLDFAIPNTEVSFPEDNTIEFKLKDSYSAFPSLLTRPVFKKGSLIGVGPYEVTDVDKSKIFIAKVLLKPKKPSLPRVTIRFYPNETTALTGFKLGEVQSIFGINDAGLKSEATGSSLIKHKNKVDFTKMVAIYYNTTDPQLSNRSLRQALSFATPLVPNEVEANNPYPSSSWAYNKDVKNYLSNTEEAHSALERAENNNEDILKKEIALTTTSQLEEIGKLVTASWREMGINAVLRVESGIPQKFQALLITQEIPADPDQYFLWHESQKDTNLTKYAQKRIDKDLEDARGREGLDEDFRKEKYFDFQRVLLEDAPATFIYFPKYDIFYLSKAENKLSQILPLQFSPMIRN